MAERFLLLRPGAIGDALLTFPALAALRRAHPDARLTLVGHPAIRELVLTQRLADQFFSRDGPELDALFTSAPALASSRIGAVTAAVIWTAGQHDQLVRNLRDLGASVLVQAPARPAPASGVHVAQHLLDSLEPLGVTGRATDWPGLSLGQREDGPASNAARAPIVLHPGSGSLQKNWPAEHFALLGVRLERLRPGRLVVLGGPAEEAVLPRLAAELSVPHQLLRERPLAELAGLLASAALYVGNDSGITHLAGICGAPTVAIFGPSEPALWRPLGRRVRVVQHLPLESLSVEAVFEASCLQLGAGRSVGDRLEGP